MDGTEHNLAGNRYFKEKEVKFNPRAYILAGFIKKENMMPLTISLIITMGMKKPLFAWEGKPLGRTSLVKHHINTGNALPIKHNPY